MAKKTRNISVNIDPEKLEQEIEDYIADLKALRKKAREMKSMSKSETIDVRGVASLRKIRSLIDSVEICFKRTVNSLRDA